MTRALATTKMERGANRCHLAMLVDTKRAAFDAARACTHEQLLFLLSGIRNMD
jgi:hypothetical protein